MSGDFFQNSKKTIGITYIAIDPTRKNVSAFMVDRFSEGVGVGGGWGRGWGWGKILLYSFTAIGDYIAFANRIDPDETAHMIRLIWIYAV